MEVISISCGSSYVSEFNNNIRVPLAGEADSPVNANGKNQFDYGKVMMDLKDVQNFLFMLIGGTPERQSNEVKGSNLNLFV